MLTPQLAQQLSEENLEKFYACHEECEAANMQPVDMYAVLKLKYKELLEKEKLMHEKGNTVRTHQDGHDVQHGHHVKGHADDHGDRDHSGSSHTGHHSRQDSHGEHHGNYGEKSLDHSGEHKPYHLNFATKHSPGAHDHDHEARMQQAEEEFLSHEMQLVLGDISDLGLGEFDHSYTTALVHKVFNVDKYEHLHTGGKGDAAEEEHQRHREIKQEVFECHICNIYFDSKHGLDIHHEHSDLHRKNILDREKRLEEAHAEALRLTGLAKKVMNTLYLTIPVKQEEVAQEVHPAGSYDAVVADLNAKEAHHKQVRGQWKTALDHVLHRRLVQKYAKMLETRINLPHGVDMLYEGSKYFYRNKTTYDLRFLHHVAFNVLEIVPHFVPFNHDKSVVEVVEDAPNGGFIACKRIYLDYNEVIKAFFGYNIVHTELTDTLKVGDAPRMQKSKGSFKRAEIAALDVYVTNRIKIHKSHAPEDALFFDLHTINHNILLKELPKRFAPGPVDIDVIRNIWTQRADGLHQEPDLKSSNHIPTTAVLQPCKSDDENDAV